MSRPLPTRLALAPLALLLIAAPASDASGRAAAEATATTVAAQPGTLEPDATATTEAARAEAAPAVDAGDEQAVVGAADAARSTASGLVIATPPGVGEPAAERRARRGSTADRDAAYQRFRTAFEAGDYDGALPDAERVVALTEALENRPLELASALNNLGATHFRLGDWVLAERAYLRALALVEEHQGSTSRRLLGPLRGLALTYHSSGQAAAAAPLLERAVAITRRSDGLFTPGQLDLLDPLIENYVALGRWQDADREHLYAYRLAERQYGARDPRMLPAMQKLALWYEQTQRFTQARRVWARVFSIGMNKSQPNPGGAVSALRGMARTYRLEYQYGPEAPEDVQMTRPGELGFRVESVERDPFGRRVQTLAPGDYRLDPQGREMLQTALKMVEGSDAPLTRAVILIELGDWTLLAERPERALPFYAQAWPLLPHQALEDTAEEVRNPMLFPAPILYRQPPAARRHRDTPPELVVERYGHRRVHVGADGRVRNVEIVEGDASDAQRSSLATALNRAVYRPRFENGQPVPTERVRFRETFRELRRSDS